jgi:hypothetical protein
MILRIASMTYFIVFNMRPTGSHMDLRASLIG